MSRQADIDKICKWMGWRKLDTQTGFIWIHGEKYNAHIDPARGSDFDPFTNPSDCAKVMDEVVKRGYGYNVCAEPNHPYWVDIELEGTMSFKPSVQGEGKGTTECEAKMNAVLAMIGGMNGVA